MASTHLSATADTIETVGPAGERLCVGGGNGVPNSSDASPSSLSKSSLLTRSPISPDLEPLRKKQRYCSDGPETTPSNGPPPLADRGAAGGPTPPGPSPREKEDVVDDTPHPKQRRILSLTEAAPYFARDSATPPTATSQISDAATGTRPEQQAKVVPNVAALQFLPIQGRGRLPESLSLDDYIKIMQIGQGAYGDVWLAEDIKHDRPVALKKLKLNEEREGFPKSSIREISLLRYLDHPNIVKFHGMAFSKPPSQDGRNGAGGRPVSQGDEAHLLPVERTRLQGAKGSVWMVFEYLPFDLTGTIDQLREQDKHLSVGEVRGILRGILEALDYCHSRNVIHRDLKSANLLITGEGRVKLADFGLARWFDASTVPLTNRVITLWYRPPELLLGAEAYTQAVDIWSAGCIFAELVMSKAIFTADKESTVLRAIAECLGPPSDSEWPGRKSLPLWTDAEANPFLSMPSLEDSVTSAATDALLDVGMLPSTERVHRTRTSEALWTKLQERIGPYGVEFLRGMLRYNPDDRLSARQALNHSWLSTGPSQPIKLARFNRTHCHAFVVRRDRERQRDVRLTQQQQQQAGGAPATTPQAAVGPQRRLAPRLLCTTDFWEKSRRAYAGARSSTMTSRTPTAPPSSTTDLATTGGEIAPCLPAAADATKRGAASSPNKRGCSSSSSCGAGGACSPHKRLRTSAHPFAMISQGSAGTTDRGGGGMDRRDGHDEGRKIIYEQQPHQQPSRRRRGEGAGLHGDERNNHHQPRAMMPHVVRGGGCVRSEHTDAGAQTRAGSSSTGGTPILAAAAGGGMEMFLVPGCRCPSEPVSSHSGWPNGLVRDGPGGGTVHPRPTTIGTTTDDTNMDMDLEDTMHPGGPPLPTGPPPPPPPPPPLPADSSSCSPPKTRVESSLKTSIASPLRTRKIGTGSNSAAEHLRDPLPTVTGGNDASRSEGELTDTGSPSNNSGDSIMHRERSRPSPYSPPQPRVYGTSVHPYRQHRSSSASSLSGLGHPLRSSAAASAAHLTPRSATSYYFTSNRPYAVSGPSSRHHPREQQHGAAAAASAYPLQLEEDVHRNASRVEDHHLRGSTPHMGPPGPIPLPRPLMYDNSPPRAYYVCRGGSTSRDSTYYPRGSRYVDLPSLPARHPGDCCHHVPSSSSHLRGQYHPHHGSAPPSSSEPHRRLKYPYNTGSAYGPPPALLQPLDAPPPLDHRHHHHPPPPPPAPQRVLMAAGGRYSSSSSSLRESSNSHRLPAPSLLRPLPGSSTPRGHHRLPSPRAYGS